MAEIPDLWPQNLMEIPKPVQIAAKKMRVLERLMRQDLPRQVRVSLAMQHVVAIKTLRTGVIGG